MIDDLKKQLLLKSKQEGEALIRQAKIETKKQIDEQRKKCKEFLVKTMEKAKRIIENEKKEKMSFARLEKKRIVLKAVDRKINSVLEQVFLKVKDFTRSKEYIKLLKKLISKGIDEVGSDKIIIHVKKGDGKKLKKLGYKIVEDLDSIGGVVIERKDRKVISDLTLETLFELKKEHFRKELYQLFKGKYV